MSSEVELISNYEFSHWTHLKTWVQTSNSFHSEFRRWTHIKQYADLSLLQRNKTNGQNAHFVGFAQQRSALDVWRNFKRDTIARRPANCPLFSMSVVREFQWYSYTIFVTWNSCGTVSSPTIPPTGCWWIAVSQSNNENGKGFCLIRVNSWKVQRTSQPTHFHGKMLMGVNREY